MNKKVFLFNVFLLLILSAVGNEKETRRKRAVSCEDRPHFACVNGNLVQFKHRVI